MPKCIMMVRVISCWDWLLSAIKARRPGAAIPMNREQKTAALSNSRTPAGEIRTEAESVVQPVVPPSNAFPTDPPADVLLHARVAPDHDWLRERGELTVRSGVVSSADATVQFHSDFGPLRQDKPTNQDYALVWKGKGERSCVPAIAIAIGDGLTSSYHSELASQAACSAALRALVAEMNSDDSRPAFDSAVAAALKAIKVLRDDLALNPEQSCPPGQFPATWKYILRQGRLFQTTLTLAWLEGDRLRVGVVGDGGCLVRATNLEELKVVAQPDLTTQEVNAIGPGDAGPIPLDQYYDSKNEKPLIRPIFAVFYTDGVGRGVGAEPAKLIEALDNPAPPSSDNPARTFIAEAIQRDPHAFDDNLTLAILRAASRQQ